MAKLVGRFIRMSVIPGSFNLELSMFRIVPQDWPVLPSLPLMSIYGKKSVSVAILHFKRVGPGAAGTAATSCEWDFTITTAKVPSIRFLTNMSRRSGLAFGMTSDVAGYFKDF